MKVFYVAHPPERHLACLLNVVRMLVRPETKHRAHVTIRGPYDAPQDERAWHVPRDARVTLGVASTFFGPAQNTVYLTVAADDLRGAWHKPDYPAFTPHLTMYDGPSRTTAGLVLAFLRLAPLRTTPSDATFHVDRLDALVTRHGPERPLSTTYDVSPLAYLLPGGTLGHALALDEPRRLTLAARVWRLGL